MLLGAEEIIIEAQEALAANDIASAAVLIPVTTGIVQALKMIGLKEKYAPLAAIGVSAGLSLMTKSDLVTHTNAIFTGIVYGLAASGLYSGLVHSLNVGKSTQTAAEPPTSPQNTSGSSIVREEKTIIGAPPATIERLNERKGE